MSAEIAREGIKTWIRLSNERNFEAMSALAAPGATWWISGVKDESPLAGPEDFQKRLAVISSAVPPTLELTLLDSVVEGGTAFIEILSKGSGPRPGQVYENTVAMKFTFEGGKIVQIREYLDFGAIKKYQESGEKPE